MRKKEQLFLNQADSIVSLTHDGINALTERYGQAPFIHKTTVIPCCVDTNLFNRANSDAAFKKSLGLSVDTKVLIHVGSVGTWYRLDQELRFFEALKNKDSTWHFVILTQNRDQAQHIVEDGSHQQVKVLSVPYKEVCRYLGMAHASIQFIEPSFAKRASSPVKFGEALAMGLPVITNQGIGDLFSYMQDNNLGICITNWEEIPVAAAGFDSNAYDAEKIRSFALEYLSLEQGIASYHQVYQPNINHD
jgi:glycosyltransferase involved in cell wall biosynthesis